MAPASASNPERLAGRVLMVGLPGLDLDPPAASWLRDLGPAGVILFARNLDTPERAMRLADAIRGTLVEPSWIAIDQEGGRVSRLRDWIGITPDAARLAAAGRAAAMTFATSTARALRALGLNLDFAPVVDLSEPGAPNGIGDRSFGSDPARVVAMASAIVDGLQSNGVAACLKHFPGLGSTRVDSHEALPVTEVARAALERDLEPFRRLGPRTASVMVGHASYPRLDPVAGRPASLSPAIVGGLLRAELGFHGLVVSDDLEMGALSGRDADGSAAVDAIEAGCDLLLYCADAEASGRARRALAARARSDRGFHDRLRDAADAVARHAARFPLPEPSVPGWARASRELVEASKLA